MLFTRFFDERLDLRERSRWRSCSGEELVDFCRTVGGIWSKPGRISGRIIEEVWVEDFIGVGGSEEISALQDLRGEAEDVAD
jgi:hypothetical protein